MAGDGKTVAWLLSHDQSPPNSFNIPFCYFISNTHERLVKIAQLTKFKDTSENDPIIKAARLDVGVKLLSLGLKSVDVPADGNSFLHAARFALLQLKYWNITLAPRVATIPSEVVSYLINARLDVIADGSKLDEVRRGMEDLMSCAGGGVTGKTSMTVGLST